METTILFLGEIVGKGGVYCVKSALKDLVSQYEVDFVIANGDGATGGFGIGKNHSVYLRKLGLDVITSGECIYYKKDMVPHIQKAPYILRAANYPPGNPGRGWKIYEKDGKSIAVISLLGQSGFQRVHLSNPFTFLPEITSRLSTCPVKILDFHAATTAEKNTMFFHADGLVSAVIGTHSKALTADERIMKKGTAVITDAGRTGSAQSVGGLLPDVEIRKFLTQIPERSQETWEGLEIQGVVLKIGGDGRALSIERLRRPCKTPEHADAEKTTGKEAHGD
ncbi:MAG: YmdB family metallophosphoesterase [Spirochaetales bacterium]|nr:YmdB family metallophosphoesterase [Spirochaetales bacterium]MCF7939269.1 YmdB family metallophosphoesterase [Spirochaetales bacterium]